MSESRKEKSKIPVSRRKFMQNAAALGVGAYVAGSVANRGIACTASEAAWPFPTYPDPPGPTVYNFDTLYDYQTRCVSASQTQNGGDVQWDLTTYTNYYQAVIDTEDDSSWKIYWSNFGFDIPAPDTTVIKAVMLKIKAQAFEDGGSGGLTQPRYGDNPELTKDPLTDTGSPGTAYDHTNNGWWDNNIQPWLAGNYLDDKNIWQSPTIPTPTECISTWMYTHWGGCGGSSMYLTVADVEDEDFGFFFQPTAKNDDDCFRIWKDPEIRVYWAS